jgi:hypothetical protein
MSKERRVDPQVQLGLQSGDARSRSVANLLLLVGE